MMQTQTNSDSPLKWIGNGFYLSFKNYFHYEISKIKNKKNPKSFLQMIDSSFAIVDARRQHTGLQVLKGIYPLTRIYAQSNKQ